MKTACTGCFKNLGVNSRIKIYAFLIKNREKNVTDITNFIGLKQPTVSYHLNEMLKTGLLSKKINGKEVIYSVNHMCPHDGYKCVVNH